VHRTPQTPERPERSRFARAVLLIVVALAICGFLAAWIVLLWDANQSRRLTPVKLMSPPVYVSAPDGDRIYLLTAQWRAFRNLNHIGPREAYSATWIDLWAIAADDATPLWRKRVEITRRGHMQERTLLGVDRGTAWLLLEDEIAALAAADGSVRAPVGHVESVNPPLRGLMPRDPKFFAFGEHGLRITSADGRVWYIDPETFLASPEPPADRPPHAAFPPLYQIPFGTWPFQTRGLDIPGAWIGLLTDEEAPVFERDNALGGLTADTRRRLWTGRSLPPSNAFGARPDYYDLVPVGEQGFVDGGLLCEYHGLEPLPAIRLSDPDSALLLHREFLGQEGRLRLARITTTDGKALWETSLPLTAVHSFKYTDGRAFLFGMEYFETDTEKRDPTKDIYQRIVVVDIADGGLHVFDHGAVGEHPEAEKVALGK